MDIEFYNKHQKKETYTRKAFPLHRDNNINFEDENGIVTWADEIDYGKVENFGWPGSNTTIGNSYASLLQAIHDNFQFLWNEIQILKGSQVTTVNIERLTNSVDQNNGNLIDALFKATVEYGTPSNTTWTLEEYTGRTQHGGQSITCQSWLTYGGEKISPYKLYVAPEGSPVSPDSIYYTEVKGERIGVTQTKNTSSLNNAKYDVYKYFYARPESIGGTTTFNGNGGSNIFTCSQGAQQPTYYGAKLKAVNNSGTAEFESILTRCKYAISASQQIWKIGNADSQTGTYTYIKNGVAITISNANTLQCTVTVGENRTGQDIPFTLIYEMGFSDGHTETTSKTCTIKKKESDTPTETRYYWYVGQDHPSENTTIVTDNNSPGWRLTGTTIDADYEFNTTDNGISDNPTRREEWYIALPVGSPYHIWDDGYTEQFDTYYATNETVEFNNVTYNIFKPGTSARTLGGQLIKK